MRAPGLGCAPGASPEAGGEPRCFRTRPPPNPPGEATARARAGASGRRGSFCCRRVEPERIAVPGAQPRRGGTAETRGSLSPREEPRPAGAIHRAGRETCAVPGSPAASWPPCLAPLARWLFFWGGQAVAGARCSMLVRWRLCGGRREGKVAGNLGCQHTGEMLCPGFTLAADEGNYRDLMEKTETLQERNHLLPPPPPNIFS